MEVPFLFCGFLHYRSLRSPQALHVQRCGHGLLHACSRCGIQLPYEQQGCANRICLFRLLVQLFHPDWILGSKLPLLYGGCADQTSCTHGWYQYRKSLAMEFCGEYGHAGMSDQTLLFSSKAAENKMRRRNFANLYLVTRSPLKPLAGNTISFSWLFLPSSCP